MQLILQEREYARLAERKAMKEGQEVFVTDYDEDFFEEESSDSDGKKPEEEKKD